jgi:hypothetical protein
VGDWNQRALNSFSLQLLPRILPPLGFTPLKFHVETSIGTRLL